MTRKTLTLAALLFCWLASAHPIRAQTPTPSLGPIYIVQAGETLWEIAARFQVDLEELKQVNHIENADWISEGQELVIPGLEDLQGYLVTQAVPLGETLRSMSRASGTSESVLRRLNRLVSPTEVYAGSRLVLLQAEKGSSRKARTSLAPGETLLELAVRQNTNPWTLMRVNQIRAGWAALPGDVLYLPNGDSTAAPAGLPPIFTHITLSPLPLVQGATAQVNVRVTASLASLNGSLADYPLHFFPLAEKEWIALQGIHALLSGGIYPLHLEATLMDGSQQTFEQLVLVEEGGFPHETLVVDRAYIDPSITSSEEAQIRALVSEATPDRL